jgi:hypothetical protein
MIENLDEVEKLNAQIKKNPSYDSLSDTYKSLQQLKGELDMTNLSRDQFERLITGWNKLNNEERNELAKYINTSEGYRQQIISNERTLTRVQKSLNSGGKTTGVTPKQETLEKPLKTLIDLQNE